MSKILSKEDGFTLIELIVVIIILGILALAGIRSISKSSENAKYQSTLREMEGLKNAIIGDERLIEDGKRVSFGYVGDVGVLPPTLQDLYSNVSTLPNWMGPYVKQSFDDDPDNYLYDGWDSLYTPDWNTASITSNGGGDPFAIYLVKTADRNDIENNVINGIVMDREGNPPLQKYLNKIRISVGLRNGIDSIHTIPTSDGMYTLSGIPIGIYTVVATHDTVIDSVYSFSPKETRAYPNVRIYPITGGQKNIKFNQILPGW